MKSHQHADPAALFAGIRPGDRVTIRVHAGIGRNGVEYAERTGRAIICGQDQYGTVALNMGGRYGTPGVATVDNLVSVRKASGR